MYLRITKDKFYIENKLRAYSHTENGQQTLSVLLYSNLLSDVRAHITFKCYPSAVNVCEKKSLRTKTYIVQCEKTFVRRYCLTFVGYVFRNIAIHTTV